MILEKAVRANTKRDPFFYWLKRYYMNVFLLFSQLKVFILIFMCTFFFLWAELTRITPSFSWHFTAATLCLCGVESLWHWALPILKISETEALASIWKRKLSYVELTAPTRLNNVCPVLKGMMLGLYFSSYFECTFQLS